MMSEMLEPRRLLAGEAFALTPLDLNLGTSDVAPAVVVGGHWYINAASDHSEYDRDLWVGDVAEDGRFLSPRLLAEAPSNPEAPSAFAWNLTPFAGELAYRLGNRLYLTDGSVEGTRAVGPVFATPPHIGGAAETPAGPRLYFAAGVDAGDQELWVTDGTTAGTRQVADINPGPAGSSPWSMMAVEDRVFFTADDGTHGRELWVTDGTAAGTRLVQDIRPGPEGSRLNSFTPLGSNLAFGYMPYGTSRYLLMKSDGTDAGTAQVSTTYTGFADHIQPVAGGIIYTSSITGHVDVFAYTGDGRPREIGDLGGLSHSSSDGTVAFLAGSDRYTARQGVYAVDLNGIRFVAPGNASDVVADGEGGAYFTDQGETILHVGPEAGEPRRVYRAWSTEYPTLLLAAGRRALVVSRFGSQAGELFFADGRPDTSPPQVTHASFIVDPVQGIRFVFDEDISATLGADDLTLTNLTTGETFIGSDLSFSAGTDGVTASWAPTAGGLILPDGNYRATLPAGSVADAAGNVLAEDVTLDFFILAGDANRDRRVDFTDFLTLRGNFGRTDDPLFSEADFNYDGKVDFGDFLILRGHFGVHLPPPGSGSLFAGADGDEEGGAAEDAS